MSGELTGAIASIGFFGSVVLIVYFTSRYNHLVKKDIIEKGGNIEITRKKFPFLEIGLTTLGIGLGLGLSVIPQSSGISEDATDALTGAFILFFGGAGLVAAYFIRRKIEKQQ